MATTPTQLDRQRIRDLTEREEQRLNERTQGSKQMYERDAVSWPSRQPSPA